MGTFVDCSRHRLMCKMPTSVLVTSNLDVVDVRGLWLGLSLIESYVPRVPNRCQQPRTLSPT